MLKKTDKNSMQTEELIGLGGAMGHPQAYGVIYYLYDSLIDQYSIHVKKLVTPYLLKKARLLC
jgi:hypothetical protein